jgi:hypothetical protein
VRVLMTGGYGCIGSWATRVLVERGQDVWIFKEDTHRLDLVLDPEKRSRVHFVAGDVSDLEGVRTAVDDLRRCLFVYVRVLDFPRGAGKNLSRSRSPEKSPLGKSRPMAISQGSRNRSTPCQPKIAFPHLC